MWMVQANSNGPVNNGLAELNHDMQDEHKEIRDGVTGEGEGLLEEDESQINKGVKDVNDGCMEVVQGQNHVQVTMQRPQQQPQGPLVCWERFLPHQSLKVLLVENDDSTRHVVSALLRNCGYEVTAVADGLQAWTFLEDLTNHVDLVLTEVVLACLSGIGLLCKIVNHKTCKNIPVIMMSSHDSMSIVFKCLSKGAVDYLVKPIRKNELKNIWQHIWRKCHSVSCHSHPTLCVKLCHGPILDSELQSSGSGIESGVWTQKSTKSKSAEELDNNTGSNDEDEIRTVGLNVRDGSDNGSGTQNSWTKRAVEVDSPKPTSPWDQLADPPDSTCAQVAHSRPKALPMTTTKECDRQDDQFDNVVMGKALEVGVPRIPNLQLEDPSEKVMTNIAGNSREKFSEINSKKDKEQTDKDKLEPNNEKPDRELRNQAAGLMGVITDNTDALIESVALDIPNDLSKVANTKDKAICETNEMPSLELSLKRLRDVGDPAICAHYQNLLRHSDLSAFSRYNSASTTNQAPTGNVGSCSPLGNSSEAAKTESMKNLQSNSNATPPNQRSNGSSDNDDMGSTTNNAFTKPAVISKKSAPKSTVKCLHPSSAFQPMQNGHLSLRQPITQGKSDAAISNTILARTRGMNQQVQLRHHHHHYHHHHHVHYMAQQQLANHDDVSLKDKSVAASRCGSSNMLRTPIESNTVNYSLNGSASGSDHWSNVQNGSSTVLNPMGTNMDSDNGVAAKGRTSGGIGFGSRTGVDQNCFAQREAALDKFCQKRKERCFEKKVRYQSRKKLAEQRPRVRGQFVCQMVHEKKDRDAPS